jgi:ABC-type multidrug transport system fused ATPase/permease subunit
VISFGIEVLVAFGRIDKFLNSEELDLGYIQEIPIWVKDATHGDPDAVIDCKYIDFHWQKPLETKDNDDSNKKDIQSPIKEVEQVQTERALKLLSLDLDDQINLDLSETDFGSISSKGSTIQPPKGKQMNLDPHMSFRIQASQFKIKKGDLVMIIGEIGSGKSSLIKTLLGEMSQTVTADNLQCVNDRSTIMTQAQMLPTCKISGSMVYLGQKPWLQTGTIKENVLLDLAYNPERFKKAINQSGLLHDIETFKEGIYKHVGEGGETLSGGQRCRVALAMCLYQNSDIYLLDDP